MMQIELYSNFNKRVNSTKVPSATGEVIDVVLKQPTSLINPVFIIKHALTNINYCKFNNRYYWVDDITVLNNDQIALSCSVDVLATYRTQIRNSSQYVLRSSSEYDGSVMDMMYPVKSDFSYSHRISTDTDPYPLANGISFCVGIVGYTPSAMGSVSYYWMDHRDLTELLAFLMNDINWTDIAVTDLVAGIQKALINPTQYIVSCMALPFPKGTGGVAVESINYGWYTVTAHGLLLGQTQLKRQFTINMPIEKHPQASARGKYLNLSPYSEYYIKWSPFGLIPIDTSKIVDSDNITLRVTIDLSSGEAILEGYIGQNNMNVIYEKGVIGAPINLSQITRNYLGMASSVVDMGSAVVSGATGNVGGYISGTVSGIGNLITSMMPQVRGAGSTGSFLTFGANPTIEGKFNLIVDEDYNDVGRPLCKIRTLSNLSGFCMTRDSDISVSATSSENEAINNFLDQGVFLE